ncbi:hypothetical protein H2203_006522 [Taxawa tesnikishii (nom. ined.)]|nr:hypothetical protein H2203_006522 [Dothideales sp. JES 119]
MDTEDGQLFIKNLAYFVRTHEKALANALQLQRRGPQNGQSAVTGGSSAITATQGSSASTSTTFAAALSLPYLNFTSQNVKPAKLTLTPHHLFYLLSRFEELGISVGPMNVRLENIHNDVAPGNYVSFLGSAPKSRGRTSDADSIHSVSSVRSVMSSMSSMWSQFTLSNQAAKLEKQKAMEKEDLRYLYSAFTKIPCLRLSPDHRSRLIAGYEEFPFDTAVPLFAFKNISALEICDLDFRQFFGWDRLSEQLRSLTIKRGSVDDLADLLINIAEIIQDACSVVSGNTLASGQPSLKHAELARSYSAPNSPLLMAEGHPLGARRAQSWFVRDRAKEKADPSSSAEYLAVETYEFPARIVLHSASTTKQHAEVQALFRQFQLKHAFEYSKNQHFEPACAGHLAAIKVALPATPDIKPDTSCWALNLSNCMIDSLHSLGRNPLPAINTINLRSNRLVSLAGVERLFSLERIDLRDNKLTDPTELARLTGIPDIQDVYVLKNPFVRTHSNYRITIFNLFRSTPGYTEDVVVDSSGPTYSERRSLVDRVPESAAVPVVRPPLEEDIKAPVVSEQITPEQERQTDIHDTFRAPQAGRRASDYGTASQRRKRGPRRRIVELSQHEPTSPPTPERPTVREIPPSPATPAEGSSGTLPDASVYHTAHSTVDAPQLPPINTAVASPSPVRERRQSTTTDEGSPVREPEDITVNSDLYRQKIEALKSDLGNGWLTALSEDKWSSRQMQERDYSPARTIKPTRSESRGVALSGRTLG